MKLLMGFFAAIHTVIAVLFVGVALMLVLIAVKAAWGAVGADAKAAAEAIIETIGLLAVAVVSLQIAQTTRRRNSRFSRRVRAAPQR